MFPSARLDYRKTSIQALFFTTVGIKGANQRSCMDDPIYRNFQARQGSHEAKILSALEKQDGIPPSSDGS